MSRRFRVPDGRHVVLPQELLSGPGATNMRLEPGAIVDLDEARCQRHQRYIAGRVRAGDLIEDQDAPDPTSSSSTPAAPVTSITTPTLPRKE